jgi:hypothetical protein
MATAPVAAIFATNNDGVNLTKEKLDLNPPSHSWQLNGLPPWPYIRRLQL